MDTKTGACQTSRPDSVVDDTSSDNKLYPLNYKTAEQPTHTKAYLSWTKLTIWIDL